MKDIIDIVFEARPAAILLEACNPRHEHEWQVFEEVKLPEGKLLIPGVIDSTNNYIEHPELIAQRLVRYANLVEQKNGISAPTAASLPVRAWRRGSADHLGQVPGNA